MGWHVQINDHTPLGKKGPILRADHGAAAGGQRTRSGSSVSASSVWLSRRRNPSSPSISKIVGIFDPGASFYLMIAVDKTPAEALCELSADRCFS
jgi:hypothetical protein